MENQVTNNNDEIEIDLGEIFHLILSRLGVIILSGIILGVISIIGTMLFITPQYESTTKIMVLNKRQCPESLMKTICILDRTSQMNTSAQNSLQRELYWKLFPVGLTERLSV